MNLRFKNGGMSQIKKEHLLKRITPVEFAEEISKLRELSQKCIEEAIRFNFKSIDGFMWKFDTNEPNSRNLIQNGYLILDEKDQILAALEVAAL